VGSRLLAVSAATDRGLVRRNNEDAILLGEWIGVGDTAAHEASFDFAGGFVQILICDGMGGHRGGAVASVCEHTIFCDAIFPDACARTWWEIGGGKKTPPISRRRIPLSSMMVPRPASTTTKRALGGYREIEGGRDS